MDTKFTKPRQGKYLSLGRFLIHANWSRSWDGWAEQKIHCATWRVIGLDVQKWTGGGYGISIYCWRLVVRVASVTTGATP